ncbi:MAG: DUF2336 domain-containing protein [Alphaproteobacteria bacterium]|nr:DUF2336 domain-containing protein [Alphaproteobacteria bacterium]
MISISDVEKLTRDPSSASRISTAARLAADFDLGAFSPAEVALAVEIFRIMLKDAEVRVRQALSEKLKSNAAIPRDIAKALAADVELIALPILEHSPVMTTEDLVEIIAVQRDPAKMRAIAGRESLPGPVTEALVTHGDEDVVALVAAHRGAVIAETTFDLMVNRFGTEPRVTTLLIDRTDLPVHVAERLTALVADHLRERLMQRHKLDTSTALELVLATRERATVDLARGYSEQAIATLAAQLELTNRLTASLVLRAICMGHRVFFEHALARRASVPFATAMIQLRTDQGVAALWTRAGFAKSLFPAIQAALAATREFEAEGLDLSANDFSRRIIERVMTQYETFGVEFEYDDLEYLFAKVTAPETPQNSRDSH